VSVVDVTGKKFKISRKALHAPTSSPTTSVDSVQTPPTLSRRQGPSWLNQATPKTPVKPAVSNTPTGLHTVAHKLRDVSGNLISVPASAISEPESGPQVTFTDVDGEVFSLPKAICQGLFSYSLFPLLTHFRRSHSEWTLHYVDRHYG
jgi:hypothetical protein